MPETDLFVISLSFSSKEAECNGKIGTFPMLLCLVEEFLTVVLLPGLPSPAETARRHLGNGSPKLTEELFGRGSNSTTLVGSFT